MLDLKVFPLKTLSWFWPNQSLLLLLSIVRLAEKKKMLKVALNTHNQLYSRQSIEKKMREKNKNLSLCFHSYLSFTYTF